MEKLRFWERILMRVMDSVIAISLWGLGVAMFIAIFHAFGENPDIFKASMIVGLSQVLVYLYRADKD
jgi:hypothetical protein